MKRSIIFVTMFKHDVQKFIDEKGLFTVKDRVLVALSGGADSVALLCVLHSLGYRCECAHCNFHLRGEESDRDEAFVRSLCGALSVPLHVEHFDTTAYASGHHLSIEMAARELRYEWFSRLCRELPASVVAVAHHRDDSVETFLLNLMRGTGIDGLRGIPAQNGRVVRPLLQQSRADILDYLHAIGQDFVTDSTNLQDEYLRNKIRLNILPLMCELNPSLVESIDETAQRLSEVAAVYHRDRTETIKRLMNRVSESLLKVSISDILTDIAPLSFLHELLFPLGFNASQVKDIYRSLTVEQPGKRFYSKEWAVLRDREHLIVQKQEGEQAVPRLTVEEVERTSSFVIPRDKQVACLDADKVQLPLEVRKWRQGDKFIPLGMKGKKNVSDYMTDRKFSLFEKDNQYVVCSGDDIVWLVNERCDHRFRITDSTRRVLLIRFQS